jgi:hypothetical protein
MSHRPPKHGADITATPAPCGTSIDLFAEVELYRAILPLLGDSEEPHHPSCGKKALQRLLEALQQEKRSNRRKKNRPRSNAARFLERLLANGPVPVSVVHEQAKKERISEPTIDRAKAKLRVKSKKIGFKPSQWEWSLP